MGQYHVLVNLTKKEVVHPHQIGNGLKLHEQVGWEYCTATALVMLLASASRNGGRGGGDFRCGHPLVGSWAGDQIAFIGNYAEQDDVPGCNADEIHILTGIACDPDCYLPGKTHGATPEQVAEASTWKNISPQVREMMSQEFDVEYSGDGWLDIKKKDRQEKVAPATAPDMVIVAPR